MDRSRLLGAILAAIVVTSPIVSSSLASVVQNAAPTPSEIRQRALDDRDFWSVERRAYKRIVDDCIRRITAGEDIKCPDINDEAAIRAFVRGDAPKKEVATGSGAIPVLTLDDISTGDIPLLRRYRNLQQCPEGLKTGKQLGFYQFCLTFIKEKRPKTEKTKLLERQVRTRIRALQESHKSSNADTLNDRIEALPDGIRPDR
jgi:hypothetical protein